MLDREPSPRPGRDGGAAPSAGLQFQLSPPYDIRDGISFASGDVTVTLAGLATVPRDAVCFNDAKLQWACGLWARAALNNLLRGAEATCFGDRHGAQPVQVSCRVRGTDLAATLVRAGFARPLDGTAFAADIAVARAGRLGLWNGEWTIREAQPSP
jgi:endonuclease YncB( thermonuclease family)